MHFEASKCISKRGGGWGSAPLRIPNCAAGGDRATLEKTGRLRKKTADSGKSACVWLPEWNESAALFIAFRNGFSSVGGLPR